MRKTIADLTNGLYHYDGHADLSDRGARRYHPFSFDFDSTSLILKDPEEHWEDEVKRVHNENRTQLIERLKHEHGTRHIENIVKNAADLGPKSMSVLAYHNTLHEQARRAFVTGAYYPALVAACALGERILNHLVLDLRHSFKSSPHYRNLYRKKSFDNWPIVISALTDWKVLADGVGAEFLLLGELRNRSIHFNPDTYHLLRDDALDALQRLDHIISNQFGYFGRQPWFIEGTPGAQFVKRSYENDPFVRAYIIPHSGFVGLLYGMELSPDAGWRHLDYADYGHEELSDEEFARRYRERDHTKVVSRKMIEKQHQAG
ncbi:hypothetical protein DBIPINDM_005030 [Mesorhizobium sp. AR02]|uniref:hypothetical protein n=1 Tax=Mesorhizobium sp. AR02 TaxID=2865837 RepID=UPI002161056D|nr:hypothetical protein [Mesorhizobium sp. AR02]UVK51726.1 hypothetical protein DBIPINDM_005030 [Mesorhizobium sp. AR02]